MGFVGRSFVVVLRLPEDGEIDTELMKKVKELNKFIDTLPPISYEQGNKRIVGININDFRS